MKIVWNRISQAEWQGALPSDACALQQSWQFGAAVQAMGRQVDRAEITCGSARALAQVISRRVGRWLQLSYLARGPIWTDNCSPAFRRDAMQRLRRRLPGSWVRLLLCVPERAAPGVLPLITPVHMAELPLRPGVDVMRSAMRGKWRNRLVRGEKSEISVKTVVPGYADIVRISKAELGQQRQRGYRNLPPAFLRAWHDIAPNRMHLYSAHIGRESIAEMLYLDHAPGVTYHIGWTNGTGRALSAHHLILWQAMQDFGAMGRQRLDLGTLDTVNNPGLARFKLGAGAVARPLGASGFCLSALPRLGMRPASKPIGLLR